MRLPSGLPRLETRPPPTGSITCTNTIGIVRVTRDSNVKLLEPLVKMTSGACATICSATRKRAVVAPQ